MGQVAGRSVALDLNETHTISLFGVQGGGKSYTLGSIIEAASLPLPPVNELPRPLATIVFHYSPTLDYAPEFTSMLAPNDDSEQMRVLEETYGGRPAALTDVVMLVPEDQLEQRRREYQGVQVLPLKFGSAELRAEHWRFLMGAIGNQSTYIRQLQRIMKAHRRDLRLDVIRDGVEQSAMSDGLKQLAQQRLDLAADYIDDDARVKQLVRPGRVIIVDLRDEFIEKDEALGLFVVLMQLFAEAQEEGERFNKLVVFDEAHKYIRPRPRRRPGSERPGDAAQGHERPRRQSGSAFGTDFAHRTVQPCDPAQVHVAGLAEAPEGQRVTRRPDTVQDGRPGARRSVRVVEQGHRRGLHAWRREGASTSSNDQARRRNEDRHFISRRTGRFSMSPAVWCSCMDSSPVCLPRGSPAASCVMVSLEVRHTDRLRSHNRRYENGVPWRPTPSPNSTA